MIKNTVNINSYYLKLESGPAQGYILELKKDACLIIGRGDTAGLRILDEKISREHCSIELTDDGLTLKDLDSRNGTYFTSEKIKQAKLDVGDRFQAGNTVFLITESIEKSGDTVISDTNPYKVDKKVKPDEISKIVRTIFQSEKANLLFQLQSALQIASDLDEFLQFVFSFVKQHFSFDIAAILVSDTSGNPCIVKIMSRKPNNFELSKDLWKKCIKNGEALLLSAESKESVIDKGYSSAICLPLRTTKEIFGVFYLQRNSGGLSIEDFIVSMSTPRTLPQLVEYAASCYTDRIAIQDASVLPTAQKITYQATFL